MPDDVPHWDSPSFGDRWYDERRTPVLVVPSVVTRVEWNVLINQEHPRFRAHPGEPTLAGPLGRAALGKAWQTGVARSSGMIIPGV